MNSRPDRREHLIRYVVEGLTDKEISKRMRTSRRNVRYHLGVLYKNLGLYGTYSRVRLAVWAVRKEQA